MNKRKRQKLEQAGWKVGTSAEFLELTKEEEELVELKVALAMNLRTRRKRRGWTQSDVAKLIGSSQPRVAKMECADRSVSLDLLIRSLLALGATRRDLARTINPPKHAA